MEVLTDSLHTYTLVWRPLKREDMLPFQVEAARVRALSNRRRLERVRRGNAASEISEVSSDDETISTWPSNGLCTAGQAVACERCFLLSRQMCGARGFFATPIVAMATLSMSAGVHSPECAFSSDSCNVGGTSYVGCIPAECSTDFTGMAPSAACCLLAAAGRVLFIQHRHMMVDHE
jgi:hypothetical protein